MEPTSSSKTASTARGELQKKSLELDETQSQITMANKEIKDLQITLRLLLAAERELKEPSLFRLFSSWDTLSIHKKNQSLIQYLTDMLEETDISEHNKTEIITALKVLKTIPKKNDQEQDVYVIDKLKKIIPEKIKAIETARQKNKPITTASTALKRVVVKRTTIAMANKEIKDLQITLRLLLAAERELKKPSLDTLSIPEKNESLKQYLTNMLKTSESNTTEISTALTVLETIQKNDQKQDVYVIDKLKKIIPEKIKAIETARQKNKPITTASTALKRVVVKRKKQKPEDDNQQPEGKEAEQKLANASTENDPHATMPEGSEQLAKETEPKMDHTQQPEGEEAEQKPANASTENDPHATMPEGSEQLAKETEPKMDHTQQHDGNVINTPSEQNNQNIETTTIQPPPNAETEQKTEQITAIESFINALNKHFSTSGLQGLKDKIKLADDLIAQQNGIIATYNKIIQALANIRKLENQLSVAQQKLDTARQEHKNAQTIYTALLEAEAALNSQEKSAQSSSIAFFDTSFSAPWENPEQQQKNKLLRYLKNEIELLRENEQSKSEKNGIHKLLIQEKQNILNNLKQLMQSKSIAEIKTALSLDIEKKAHTVDEQQSVVNNIQKELTDSKTNKSELDLEEQQSKLSDANEVILTANTAKRKAEADINQYADAMSLTTQINTILSDMIKHDTQGDITRENVVSRLKPKLKMPGLNTGLPKPIGQAIDAYIAAKYTEEKNEQKAHLDNERLLKQQHQDLIDAALWFSKQPTTTSKSVTPPQPPHTYQSINKLSELLPTYRRDPKTGVLRPYPRYTAEDIAKDTTEKNKGDILKTLFEHIKARPTEAQRTILEEINKNNIPSDKIDFISDYYLTLLQIRRNLLPVMGVGDVISKNTTSFKNLQQKVAEFLTAYPNPTDKQIQTALEDIFKPAERKGFLHQWIAFKSSSNPKQTLESEQSPAGSKSMP